MHSLAVVFVRGLGAFLAVTFLSSLGVILGSQLIIRGWDEIEFEGLSAPAAMIVVGILLMVWSKNLARLLTAGITEPAGRMPDARHLLLLGTALLGLFFVASAVPNIARAVWLYSANWNEGVDTRVGRINATALVFNAAGSVVIGGILLWLARPLWSRTKPVQ